MAKILIVSHSPYCSTGYGRVVRGLAGSLIDQGNQIVCLGMGTRSAGKPLPYPVIPWNKLSVKEIAEAITQHKADVLLTLGDPWMYEGVPAMRERQSVVWLAYYPVDGQPLPAPWKRWAEAVDVPVVFSKFARDVVQKAIGKAPELIYHGVNTQTFSPDDRAKAKELAHVAGHFVVGTVARNQLRKNIPALVSAFSSFAKDKDDALLYLHTQLKGEYDIAELVRSAGIEEKTRITEDLGADKGVSDHLLATVYRALDVFVLPTMAEGFGLPIMESQACGTPALVTDFSACPELVPDPIQRLRVKTTLTMSRNLEQAIVDVDDITEKLELLYRDRQRLKDLSAKCHQFAQPFEWANKYEQFKQLLASERFTSLLAAKNASRGSVPASANDEGPFSRRPIGSASSGGMSSVKVGNGQPLERLDVVEQLHSEAVAMVNAGAVAEAVPLLRRVAELCPKNPDYLNQLAVALHAAGKIEEASRFYRRSLELQPNRHLVWTNLATARLSVNDLQGARSACQRALKLVPNFAVTIDLLGSILLKENKPHEAKTVFEQALKLTPDLTSAKLHLAESAQIISALPALPPAGPDQVDETNAQEKMSRVIAALAPYPGGFDGRGVVIVGGGIRYFPCAWVCIRMLRDCGCSLPIELWHLGSGEMSDQMRELVTQYNVACIDGAAKALEQLQRELGGWELKSFAIKHSRFREVVFLDADNFPLVDPEFLFETPEYREHGAIFWPDYDKLGPEERIWNLTGVTYQSEPTFESGQIVVDKSRCWEPLSLTVWFNENSAFWYRHMLGDKETFHMAWRKLNRSYAMPKLGAKDLLYAIPQQDFTGRRIFQHRNRAKWVLSGWNPRMDDFEKEDQGFAYLDELRILWNPEQPRYDMAATEVVQLAWKSHNSSQEKDGAKLSAAVEGPKAWKLIGDLADHTARCIIDAHTINVAERALDAAPHVAELHAILGTSLGTLGRHEQASRAFEAAMALNPDLPGLKHNLHLAAASSAAVT